MRKLTTIKFTALVFSFLFIVQSLFAQTRQVTGTVSDQTGKGVPGVTVTVKGTSNATQTDANGSYKINAPENATLVFSSVGYGTSEVQIGSRTSVDQNLTASNDNLSEVVVIGYGTARKKRSDRSCIHRYGKEFNKGCITSPDQLIQGKVAGLLIVNNSGQPGGATTVKIRGNATVTGSGQPLYVVDGIPLDGRTARPGLECFRLRKYARWKSFKLHQSG